MLPFSGTSGFKMGGFHWTCKTDNSQVVFNVTETVVLTKSKEGKEKVQRCSDQFEMKASLKKATLVFEPFDFKKESKGMSDGLNFV